MDLPQSSIFPVQHGFQSAIKKLEKSTGWKKKKKDVSRTAKCERLNHRKMLDSAMAQTPDTRPGIEARWTTLQQAVARSPIHQMVQAARFRDSPS